MATYGGQNIGAKKLDRISRGLKAASVMGCVYAVLARSEERRGGKEWRCGGGAGG